MIVTKKTMNLMDLTQKTLTLYLNLLIGTRRETCINFMHFPNDLDPQECLIDPIDLWTILSCFIVIMCLLKLRD